MSWRELFERAADHDVTVEEVQAAVARRREADDGESAS
jgi:hypothetical protein